MMQESKRVGAAADKSPEVEYRKSDATNDETLSDLEENEADVGSSSSTSDAAPAPDGTLDESDEIKDAGPM